MRKLALLAVIAGVIAVVGPMSAASAKEKTLVDITGQGTWVDGPDGSVIVTGEVVGKPLDGPYEVTLSARDGSLPDPGVCEEATVRAEVTGARGKFLKLIAAGQVCGEFVQPPFIATERFTGRYVVKAANPARVLGTDGFVEVVLGNDGTAGFFAIDT
jgi:hypothetical protein